MSTSEKFLYLIAGTGIGAALGILFAPGAGSETRKSVVSQAHRGMDLISEKVEEGRKFVNERGGAAGTVRNMVDRGKQQVNDTLDSVRSRFSEAVDVGKQQYRDRRGEGAL
jgi:gas vesicle protein